MSDRLTAYVDGRRAGWFTRARSGGGIVFSFDDEWRENARRMELSLSMPKSRREHTGHAPENYLWNLLPDNEGVLRRWGTKFSVSPRNPMALLEHVGRDTAGAVQLAVQDERELTGPAGFEPVSESEIAEHIRQLRVDPDAWLFPGHESGYFSLAGAQSKFALTELQPGLWAVPTGRAPSTHILKPGIRGLDHSDLNEHLSLAAAAKLGLRAAHTEIHRFQDESVIVVARYDRERLGGGEIARLHQEDMAQAAGVHPAGKYQNQGGPGIAHIVELIRSTRSRGSSESAEMFFEATLFNWAILGTDAHAKNYSLLHSQLGPRLAPLYDVATGLPYPDINTRKAKLAMALGKHYVDFEIEPRHVLADAIPLGFNAEWAFDRARAILGGVADAYSQAAKDAGLKGADAAFAGLIVDRAAARAEKLYAALLNTPRPTQVSGGVYARSSTKATSEQARDRGRFTANMPKAPRSPQG